jgi:hypothetical protein
MTGPHQIRPQALKAVELAQTGMYVAEIARQVGMSHRGVVMALERNGARAGKYAGQRHAHGANTSPRAEKMAGMYRQGLTLEKIGQQYGITRERVRQILKKQGVVRADCLRSKHTENKESVRQARMEASSLVRWGMPRAEAKQYRDNGLIGAYESQRNAAHGRGIKWSLLFSDWLAIWQKSGKLELRGRGNGKYCMSRIKDEGGYVLGNVHIQLAADNSKEAVSKWLGKTKVNHGVHYTYPGTGRPWVVKVCRQQVGRYEHEDEAAEARLAYITAQGMSLGSDGRVLPSSHRAQIGA